MNRYVLASCLFAISSLGAAPNAPLTLLDEADTIHTWRGVEPVADPVRQGKAAARWVGCDRGTVAATSDIPADWSAYNVLSFSLHSDSDTPRTIIIVADSENEEREGGDYFIAKLQVNWVGWRDVSMPFSRFATARQPNGWQAIDDLRFHSRGWNVEPVPGTAMVLDNITLHYSEKVAARMNVPKRKKPKVTLKPFDGTLRFPPLPWTDMLARADADPAARAILNSLIRNGKHDADDPVFTRKYRLEDIPENQRDGRYKYAGPNAEIFALAMNDCRNAAMIHSRIVPAALCVLATNDQGTLQWLTRQLREVATWHPIQRPGWTAYSPDRKLPRGGDGSWLATGYAMRGLVHTLLIVGHRLPENLVTELRTLIQNEIDQVKEDWRVKRQWFVRGDVPSTNQWVLPNAAMIYGAMFLGDEKNRPAYELGVTNLARTCLSQGEDGSWNEGLSYGLMSVEYLFWTAWAMERNGDDRLLDYGFTKNYPNWVVHMAMPGGYSVNAFDCGRYQVPTTPHNSFLLSMMLTSSQTANWAVDAIFRGLPHSLLGLLYRYDSHNRPGRGTAPTPYAFFEHQQVLTWRSGWDQKTAMGVWMRGGSPRDAHSHRDNGHVSIYNGTDPVLIECGTPSYADPDLNTKYGRAAGHNILQVDEVLPRGRGCHTPITVRQLDEQGGRVTMDGTLAFNSVDEWIRAVDWETSGHVRIEDRVIVTHPVTTDILFFRFHTGSPDPVTLQGEGRAWAVTWKDVRISFEADRDISVDQVAWPDRSGLGKHACIDIRAGKGTRNLRLTTDITFERKVSRTENAPSYDTYRGALAKTPPGRGVTVVQAETMTAGDDRFTISETKIGADVCIYNWNDLGQTLSAPVTIGQTGRYRVLIKCCTGANAGIPVRSIAWDDSIPFKEAGDMVFPPTGGWSSQSDDWQCRLLGQDRVKGGFEFMLEAGEHRLSLVNEGGGGLNVDYVVVFPADQAPDQVLERIEPGRNVVTPEL